MSLAIFINEAARVLSAPLAKTISSCAERPRTCWDAERKGRPGHFGNFLGRAFRKFRVCVESGADGRPADGQSNSPASATAIRHAIAIKQPDPAGNSWPTVIGTASIRCVRPILTTP